MIESPREVLERFYAAERIYMAAGGVSAGASFDGIGATLHPDVQLHQSPDLPWGGEWRGYEGFKGWSVEMSRHFDIVDVQDAQFLTTGNQVVVLCTLTTRSRNTGRTISAPMVQVVTVEDGRITEFRPFYWNVAEYVTVTSEPSGSSEAQA
jgi:ketosteroid isomerase-like protein